MSDEPRYLGSWEIADVGGTVVAVDVLRAFTTAAYALDAGAARIWLVAGVAEALDLAATIPGALVLGEDHGRRPDGFDLSNSPVAVSHADVAGRDLVQRTSAGTGGVAAALGADRLFAASLVCASATAAAVAQAGPEAPTYLLTGRSEDGTITGSDDLATAQLIERARTGQPLDAGRTAAFVAGSQEAARTLAIGAGHVDPDDIRYATDVDRFDFAMPVHRVGGRLELTRLGPR